MRTGLFVGVFGLALLLGSELSLSQEADERGKALIRELGCPVCHEIKGHGTNVRGEAPDLTFEGDRVKPEWLFAFLKKPHTIRPALRARMPNFRLTDREALALTEYLITLKDPKAPPVPVAQRFTGAAAPANLEAARKLTSKDYLDCFNCHQDGDRKPGGKPEEWAPDLSEVAARLNPAWVVRWLRDPSKIVPGAKMPSFFEDENSGPDDILGGDETAQILALRDYLMSRGAASDPGYQRAKAEHQQVSPAQGRSLIVKLNCIGCHRVTGLPERKRIAPPLTFQGSRVRRDWLEAFLRRPGPIKPEYAIMGSEARMPDFRLSDAEVQTLTNYIMNHLVDHELPRLPPEAIAPALASEGERLFGEKYCDNCHRIGSRPGGIGPDLTYAWKRLNPAWVNRFVLNPSHYLDTRMPNLRLSEAEAKAVTAYLMHARDDQ